MVFIQAPTTFSSSTYFCHLRIPFPKDFRKLFVRYLKGKAKSRKGNDRLLNQSVGLDHSSERSVCEDGGYSVRYEAVDGGCGCRRKPRVTEISFNGKSK